MRKSVGIPVARNSMGSVRSDGFHAVEKFLNELRYPLRGSPLGAFFLDPASDKHFQVRHVYHLRYPARQKCHPQRAEGQVTVFSWMFRGWGWIEGCSYCGGDGAVRAQKLLAAQHNVVFFFPTAANTATIARKLIFLPDIVAKTRCDCK
ncbi:hypothetical protein [Rhizobium mayense]|uniref:Uncharacterized protein n=1 Tax=Rhizobium mayense TaxID=1312184 RepID=A0ABT7JXC6_9HYPH|nr:hypothetical protein [Rhizobium mayense]MDL2400400.1 hypothetical protein [Rhizobium mayense]